MDIGVFGRKLVIETLSKNICVKMQGYIYILYIFLNMKF